LATPSALAATKGRIVGRVLNATTGEPQPGVKVTLVGANEDGSDPMRRVAESDNRGRYAFEELETGPDRFYTLDARYAGGLFPGRAISLPADTERSPALKTTLRVWETTNVPDTILIRRDAIFAVPADEGIGIIESVTITNTSRLAYVGRGGPNSQASVGFALPNGAGNASVTILDSTYDVPEIVRTDFGFAATIAVPPGEMKLTFTYPLSGSGGSFDLSRTALYPILDLSVFAADPLRIESNRLEPTGEEHVGGRNYRIWATDEDIAAGDPVQLNAIAEADTGPLLLGAIAASLAVLIAVATWSLRRRRRFRARTPEREPAPDHLVDEIAALDLSYRAGEIGEEEWTRRRADLKRHLQKTRSPEPTR
jgi:hypothetical protein